MIPFDGQSRGERGRMALLRHIERTGCTIAGDPVWTDDEIARLCAAFPDRKAACVALPRRTLAAVMHKARQLGLVPSRRIWTSDEAIRLRKPYVAGIPMSELLEMFPGKTRSQIWRKARDKGYRRPRRAPTPTGMPLVDSIRKRAFECRLSMTDLDAFVGRRRYFVSPSYMDWRALQRAMILLGGRPTIFWAHA
ncbi:hypothetical protein QUC32_15540 [Novosphingobium resinovorum]|jgi:hypothetical protein|uniref:Uncharacterized protein n=1 Tax=Novosphingobium resinovorum TaxID=158500 RepID=A0A031K6R8_9SPHN|nr:MULTISPECIES: hypothetical protein [Sphingomonadaceae]EZP84713.1 hypothetical protein BV97_00471 [Novosphingobium resinovorum]MBF7011081.1 hypothetical protein [Novosphingobium sp. HR1a]WJM29070.1 hypothetical protein QUC32_15540 [Novosphingobium resinovorum]